MKTLVMVVALLVGAVGVTSAKGGGGSHHSSPAPRAKKKADDKPNDQDVDGYTRKDGKHVDPYKRSAPEK